MISGCTVTRKASLAQSQGVTSGQEALLPNPKELLDIFDECLGPASSESETAGTLHRKPSMSLGAASLLMPKEAAKPAKEPATSKQQQQQQQQQNQQQQRRRLGTRRVGDDGRMSRMIEKWR